MASVNSEIEEDVRNFVMNDINKRAKMLAEKAFNEIEDHYEKFVQKWYDAGPVPTDLYPNNTPGDPHSYDRSGNTFYGSSGYNKDPIYNIVDRGKYIMLYVGIVVSPWALPFEYDDPRDYVFNRTFELGIHGTIPTGGKTKSPKEYMDLWFALFEKNRLKQLENLYFNS